MVPPRTAVNFIMARKRAEGSALRAIHRAAGLRPGLLDICGSHILTKGRSSSKMDLQPKGDGPSALARAGAPPGTITHRNRFESQSDRHGPREGTAPLGASRGRGSGAAPPDPSGLRCRSAFSGSINCAARLARRTFCAADLTMEILTAGL